MASTAYKPQKSGGTGEYAYRDRDQVRVTAEEPPGGPSPFNFKSGRKFSHMSQGRACLI